MKKVKSFLNIFGRSLFPTDQYYKKILKTRLNISIKYFFFLLIFFNFIFSLSLLVRFSPKKILNTLNLFTLTLQKYPDDLIISIKDGSTFTNYNHPYFLWMDYQDKKKLLFVVDETASTEKIKIYN